MNKHKIESEIFRGIQRRLRLGYTNIGFGGNMSMLEEYSKVVAEVMSEVICELLKDDK